MGQGRQLRGFTDEERTHHIDIKVNGKWRRVSGLPLPLDVAEYYAHGPLFRQWEVRVVEGKTSATTNNPAGTAPTPAARSA